MPRDMFGDIVEPSAKVGSRSWYTLPLSIALHTIGLTAVVIIPLMAADVLPSPPSMMGTFIALPPPPLRTVPKPVETANPSAAPVEAPREIAPETGLESGPKDAANGLEDGIGILEGSTVSNLDVAPPPPPPPLPTAVRVGGNIKPPARLRNVNPVYPAIAQSARVQGVVIIEATIGPNGLVTEARILKSIPLLDAAALDAVKQWQYTPTLLNGVPVPVIMTVTVNFTLQ